MYSPHNSCFTTSTDDGGRGTEDASDVYDNLNRRQETANRGRLQHTRVYNNLYYTRSRGQGTGNGGRGHGTWGACNIHITLNGRRGRGQGTAGGDRGRFQRILQFARETGDRGQGTPATCQARHNLNEKRETGDGGQGTTQGGQHTGGRGRETAYGEQGTLAAFSFLKFKNVTNRYAVFALTCREDRS